MPAPRIYIVGGGVIGLSLALQLRLQGKEVVVLERHTCGDTAHGAASPASAGMLGVYDPHHPEGLQPLADFSYQQWPEFLQCIQQYSGKSVTTQTTHVLEAVKPGGPMAGDELLPGELQSLEPELVPGGLVWCRREEPCLDPRELLAALLAACLAVGVVVKENEPVTGTGYALAGNHVTTTKGSYHADQLVFASGAWTAELTKNSVPTEPRRGQMLVLEMPDHAINHTVRGLNCYVVPRGDGRLIVGSTVERAGFDFHVQQQTMERLHIAAAQLFPRVASSKRTDQWAGLRPGTPDDLPVLGPLRQEGAFPSMPRMFAATGHFRNGILLAPGTAHLMAQVLNGLTPTVPLANFSPSRFFGR